MSETVVRPGTGGASRRRAPEVLARLIARRRAADHPLPPSRSQDSSGALRAAEDARLMLEVRAGSVEAFESLLDRYIHRAYRVACSVALRPDHAAAAVQQTFETIWRGPDSYEHHRSNVAVWLLRCVRDQAIDQTATARVRDAPPLRDRSSMPPDATAEMVAGGEDAHARWALLAHLPDDQREVISLSLYGGLSHSEIASILGCPSGTVKALMRLGLENLRSVVS